MSFDSKLSITLFPHQVESVKQMEELEHKKSRPIKINGEPATLNTRRYSRLWEKL